MNLSSDLSTSKIARELYLSSNYLSKLFRKETGKSVTEYINERRIQMAEQLLKSGTGPIQDIATHVGFYDVSYFCRQFKKITGISAQQYRKAEKT